jgi:WD40 repeat protein
MRHRTFRKVNQFMQRKRLFHPLHTAFWLCLIGLVFFGNTSCSEDDNDQRKKALPADAPFLEIDPNIDMGSISTVQNMLMAAGQDGNLYLWDWRDLSKEPKVAKLDPTKSWIPRWRDKSPPLLHNRVCTLLSHRWIVHASHEEDDMSLIVREVEGGGEIHRWSIGEEWNCDRLRSTRNGKFVAVYLNADLDECIEGVNYLGHARGYRLGLIGPSPTDIQWLPTFFRNEDNLPIVRVAAASEDGNYICAVGNIDGGWIMLADVVRKEVVWEKLPKGGDVPYGQRTVAFNDVCFSPDSKRIYVAGNTGLFCFDVATGKIIKQWPMPARAASVAISPDERLVAGGLPGTGDVYVCDVNSTTPIGSPILRLRTGQYSVYGLAFSPDSTLLATEGVKRTHIKIWKMPPPALEKKTSAQKNE